jgi:hypothetical protein
VLAAEWIDSGSPVKVEATSTASEAAKIDRVIEKTTSSMVVLEALRFRSPVGMASSLVGDEDCGANVLPPRPARP